MPIEDAIACWIADLDHADKRAVRRAVNALRGAAARSPETAASLAALLEDAKRPNRWTLAYVLAQLPDPSETAISALLDGLGHPDPDIRWAIGLLLVRLAQVDTRVAASLLGLCARGTPTQRRLAIYCIRDLNLQDAASREAILEALSDTDPLVRIAAAGSLRRAGKLSPADDEKLLEVFLSDSDGRVRSVAAVTLAQRGYCSQVFLQALMRARNGADRKTERAARAALELLGCK